MTSKVGIGFHGGIGNWVMFTPLLQLIKEELCDPDLIFDSEWKDNNRTQIELMAKNSPFINSIIEYDNPSILDNYKKTYMSYHSSVCDALFLQMNPLTLKDSFSKFPVWRENFLHEINWYLIEASEKLNLQTNKEYPQYVPTYENKIIDAPYFVLSNGYLRTDDGLYDKKSWRDWNILVDVLKEYYEEYSIVLLGGKEDDIWGQQLENKGCINLVNKMDIIETSTVIKYSSAIISTDTGVFHIADALKIPGVVMFGATLISKNGPKNNTIIPLRSFSECSPCQGTSEFNVCKGGCMEKITTGMIMGALRSILLS